MVFTSIEFLFLFFPITLIIHFILPQQARNYWLLIVSLLFYAWGEPEFVVIMCISIVFNYFCALRIEELIGQNALQKIMLTIAVMGNLGLLFVFKYTNFVISSLHHFIPKTEEIIGQTNIVLPIGISFFTFQALSYIIDVYRGLPAQKKLGYLGLYIAFFPQLIAGPIVRYTTIMDQIEKRKITMTSFSQGMLRFLYGFNKKILLANILSETADKAFAASEVSVTMAWLGAVCYTLQIYFDFSGYSEMAIGLGKMFGFDFGENFHYPYISKNISEFWRRWHISLGSWFRDYVYFPLGGSRVNSKFRLVFNLSVVWLVTGIWHGANWTFILWGVLHGFFVIIEKICKIPEKIQFSKLLQIIYQLFTMLIVILGWVLFRADSLSNAFSYIQAMFGIKGNILWDVSTVFCLKECILILVVGLICSTPIVEKIKCRISNLKSEKMTYGIGYVIQVLLFVISISYLVMNAHNPFIYFNF